jgi:ABC-2 type transport system ATP-binding protein
MQTMHEIQSKDIDGREDRYAIRLINLAKSYGNMRALKGINLDVRKGEIFGFLGPNGAGKTTTIRCILDTIRPDSGEISVFNLNPQVDPVSVQRLVGYLPGETQYFDNFTAKQQLQYFNDLRGRDVSWERITHLAEVLDLDLTRPIKNLSKGNKQKVGVIQALMHQPEVLILDEPTSGLDPIMQQEVISLIREAHATGTTVFFSSHIMSEVENLAERVALIRSGEIVEVAETALLTQRTLHRITIRFKQPVNGSQLQDLDGVKILSQPDNSTLTLQVSGDMEALVKELARLRVYDLGTSRASLEEVFLAYYQN